MVKTHKTIHSTYYTIVHFKRLGSRHIHKEIQSQKAITEWKGFCVKILIPRHTYKCNTFSDVDFDAFLKLVYELLWYLQFQ